MGCVEWAKFLGAHSLLKLQMDVPVRVGALERGFGGYVHGQDSAYPTDAPASSGAGSGQGAARGGS